MMPFLMILIAGAAAVPELSQSQQQQLNTATDDSSMLDEAAWYPLFQNVLSWEGDVRPGSMHPDYKAIFADPARFRGQRFVLSGMFAGVPRDRRSLKIDRFARPGPWDGKLEQWGVLVQRNPDEVVVVCLLDPQPLPRPGTAIEVVARFYKVWKTLDLRNVPTRFLVFVGKSATITAQAGEKRLTALHIVMPLVVGLGLIWLILRKSVAGGRTEHRRTVFRQPALDQRETSVKEPEPLPTDPAEALRELSRRGGGKL